MQAHLVREQTQLKWFETYRMTAVEQAQLQCILLLWESLQQSSRRKYWHTAKNVTKTYNELGAHAVSVVWTTELQFASA